MKACKHLVASRDAETMECKVCNDGYSVSGGGCVSAPAGK